MYSELLVFDPLSYAATSIDMIAYDATIEKFVAIEVKTVSPSHTPPQKTLTVNRDMKMRYMKHRKKMVFLNYLSKYEIRLLISIGYS